MHVCGYKEQPCVCWYTVNVANAHMCYSLVHILSIMEIWTIDRCTTHITYKALVRIFFASERYALCCSNYMAIITCTVILYIFIHIRSS